MFGSMIRLINDSMRHTSFVSKQNAKNQYLHLQNVWNTQCVMQDSPIGFFAVGLKQSQIISYCVHNLSYFTYVLNNLKNHLTVN